MPSVSASICRASASRLRASLRSRSDASTSVLKFAASTSKSTWPFVGPSFAAIARIAAWRSPGHRTFALCVRTRAL